MSKSPNRNPKIPPYRLRRVAFLIAVISACAAAPRAGASCSQTEIAKTSTALDSARQTLLALPVADDTDTHISRPAQAAITAMKEALDHFAVAYMQCVSTSKPDPQKIQTEISEKSHAATQPSPPAPAAAKPLAVPIETPADAAPSATATATADVPPATTGKYGRELSFEVGTSADARRLVSIVAKFSIQCGTDAVFWIFTPEGRSWREALRWQGVPYSTVSGAYDAFDYSISPPDDTGNWFVVTKNLMPSCTPNLSEIRYALLRPNEESPRPKALLARKEPIVGAGGDLGSVHAEKDSFEIRFRSSSIDASVHNRLYIMHYGINGDTLAHTQPVATNPRDFVDDWLRVPWLEAQQWSDKTVISSLRNAHAEAESLEKDGNLAFEAVHRCGADANDYEVTLAAGTAKKLYFRAIAEPAADASATSAASATANPSTNFSANGNANANANAEAVFTMHAASTSPSSACKGDNLLDTMQTK
jgi:hypothetical protein